MKLTTLFVIVSIAFVSEGTKAPFGDVRNCPSTSPLDSSQPLYQMEVLPGIGHDNLRSIDMGQVLNYNYSRCQISKDGKYLLPDEIFLIPIQQSSVETSAEYFDHWDNYTSTISYSLSVHGGIQGLLDIKFSTGYTHTKSHMYNQNSKMTRAQIRYRLYTVSMQPGAQLHPAFKARLYDIAAYLQNNDTEQARFLSETIIRDYGTHCITSVDAGGLIVQTSFIRSSYVQESSSDNSYITLSASAVLLIDAEVPIPVDIGSKLSFSANLSRISSFLSNRVHSKISTVGGPPYQSNFSLSDWEAGVPDSLVAIDRSGIPLHYIINDNTLPELPPLTVQMLSDIIYEAIKRYYRINTRHGCTDPNAKNFNFQANVDNYYCDYPSDNFTFGGIYQNCTMDPDNEYRNLCTGGPQALQLNPLTGELTCPTNYSAVKLHSGTIVQVTNHVPHRECHRTWYTLGIWKKCKTVYSPEYSKAHYEAYWCAARPGAQIPRNAGYLFGGLYTAKYSNPVTNTNGCPRFFFPLRMGEDVRVCVSTDYERAYARSVPFAGFQSCESGNPLASVNASDSTTPWPHECPIGYAQHLVSVVDGCEINYCVQLGSFASKSLLPPHLPPFHKQPKHKLNINSSDTMILVGANSGLWAKDSTGKWVNYVEPSTFSFELWYSLDPAENDTNSSPMAKTKKGGPSSAAVAVGSVIGTLALGTIIIAVVFIGRYAFKKKRGGQDKYIEINNRQSCPSDLTTENA